MADGPNGGPAGSDSAAAPAPGQMSDEQYNAIVTGTKPTDATPTPPPAPGWGDRISAWTHRAFAGSLGDNLKAAGSAAAGTAEDLGKDVARGATEGVDNVSNAVVSTGRTIADKTGLGPAVVGDAAWHDNMSNDVSATNPFQFGDDFRDRHFGEAPKGLANQFVTGAADFLTTGAVTGGLGKLAEAGKLGEAAAAIPKFWQKALSIGGTQALGSDPRAQRLSSMVQNVPVIGPVVGALATKPGDSDTVAQAKNVVENIVTASLFEGLAKGLGAQTDAKPSIALQSEKPDVVNVVDRGNGTAELQPKSERAVTPPARMLTKASTNGAEHVYTASHNGVDYKLNVTEADGGKTLKANVAPAGNALEGGFDENKAFDPTAADEAQRGPNELGPRQVRQALSELSQDFPNAEKVSGMRVSGARTGPAGAGESEGAFDLSRFRKVATDNPIGPRADIESLGAATNEAAAQHAQAPGTLTDLQKAKVVDLAQQINAKATPQDIDRLAKGTVFNFNYVHGPDAAKSYIEAMADVLHKTGEPTRSGAEVQPHEATLKLAHGLFAGQDPDQAVASIAKGLAGSTAGLRAKVTAARIGLQSLAQQIHGLSINADENPHNTLAMENLSRALDTFFAVHEHLSGSTTEIAGALEAHKIPVGGLTQNLDGADAVAGADPQAMDAAQRSGAAADADKAAGVKVDNGTASPSVGNASRSKAAEYIQAKRPEGVSKTAAPTPREYRDLARSIRLSNGDPDAVLAAIRSTKRIAQIATTAEDPSTMRKAINAATQYRLAAMLSGPKTAATIVFNQAMTAVQMPVERMWAGVRSGNPALRQQGWDQLVGLTQGWQENLSAAKRAWDIGNNILDPQAHALDTGPAPLGSSWLGRLANVPSRFHIAANEFFKQANYRASVRAMSLRASQEAGADASTTTANLQGDLRYAYDLNGGAVNPVALQYAREATFTNPLGDDTIGGKLQSASSAHPLVKFVVPFVRTPTNIFRYAWQRTPILGRFQQQMAADLASGGERAAVANAKQELGAVLYGTAAYWAVSGRVTGKGPTDPELRAQWLAAGHQPYSFRFGNTWVSYRRADPSAAPIGLLADAATGAQGLAGKLTRQVHEDRVDDDGVYHPAVSFLNTVADFAHASGHIMSDEGEQVASSLIASVGQNLSSKTYMQGVSEFFDAFANGDQHKVTAFMRGEAGTFVPNILAQLNPDQTKHETRSIVQSLMARVPCVSPTLEPKRNIFGEKIMYPAGYLDYANKALNPFTAMKHDPSIDDDLIDLGKGMAMPAEKVSAQDGMNQIDLTDRDLYKPSGGKNQSPYDRMLELMGAPTDGSPSLRQDMTDLITSDDWKDADPSLAPGGERYLLAQRLIQEHQRDAMDQVREEYPKLDDALDGIHSLRSVARRGAQDDIDQAFAQFRAAHRP